MRQLFKIMSLLVLLAVILTLNGCQKANERPKDILPEDKFVHIVINMYLAEAKLNSLSLPKDSAMKLFLPFEADFLKKNNVNDSTLNRTYQYYFDHPVELEKVYDIVIDSLNLLEQKEIAREGRSANNQ